MEGGNREPKIVASRGRGGGTTTRSTQGRLNEHDNECTKGQLCSIVDDIYKNRPPRIYRKTAPTIRANHAGDLKVVREHDSNKDSE